MVDYSGKIVRMRYVGNATVREVKPEDQIDGRMESPYRLTTTLSKDDRLNIAWM